jgi:hypothetical protein
MESNAPPRAAHRAAVTTTRAAFTATLAASLSRRAALALGLLGAAMCTPGCFLFSRGSGTASSTPTPPAPTAPAPAELALSTGFGAVAPLTGMAGGRVSAAGLGPGCTGSISEAPSAVLHIGSGGLRGVRLLARSEGDTTLVIRHPDGSYSCDDDSGGSRNPKITSDLAEGDHSVWVGHYSAGGSSEYSLTITEDNGTLTIENRTSIPICRVEHDDGLRMVDAPLRIEPGASGTLTLEEQLLNLWIHGCDGRVLFGAPNPSLTAPGTFHLGELEVSTLTLVESEAAVGSDAARRFLVAAPMTTDEYLAGVLVGLRGTHVSDAMNTPALRTAALDALRGRGRSAGWTETFLAFRVTSESWTTVRHRLTGVILHQVIGGVSITRHDDGMCAASWRSFTQEHDGRGFSGPIVWSLDNGTHRIPCAVAESATAARDWAH